LAVYTDISEVELGAFLAGYDIGELLSYKGIAEGVENSNFLLHTTSGSYILTLYEKRVNPADLPFFLGLMQHLAEKGHPMPAAGRAPRRRNHRSSLPAARPLSSPSSKACGCGARPSSTAGRLAQALARHASGRTGFWPEPQERAVGLAAGGRSGTRPPRPRRRGRNPA
jgi:hypothetical protein